MGEEPDINIDLTTGLGGGALGAFLTTLLVGALLIALTPRYTDRMTNIMFERPINSFLYGIFALLALFLLSILLVITIVGIFVVIPLLIVAYLVWAVGSSLAFLSIGERLVDRDGWELPLLVGALINGGLTLTGVGALVSLGIGAIGFGAVLQEWQR